MNFLLSTEWLKEFVSLRETPEKLAQHLSLSGPSVDRLYALGKQWEKMVAGKVLQSEKHPNADRLTVNTVDIGGRQVEIVCGAPNVRVGMLAAVALPGARVRWHGEGDLVTLEATTIRGVKSVGMICAANEIGLEKFPGDGIMDISFTNAKPGTPLASALQLDDVIFDVEVTSNRPDMMSVVGLAREAAAITGAKFLYKEQEIEILVPERSRRPALRQAQGLSLAVTVAHPDLCPRIAAIMIDGVRVGPSPWWMQKRLLLSGLRPINNIVDITNYVLLEQGKPLHAFDAKKLSPLLEGEGEGEVKIVVRRAKKGETVKALDGKTYTVSDPMVVLANERRVLGIAGVMGGEESGVHDDTTTVILISEVFDPVSIRKTARALNLHSDASNLFEKGLSTESVLPALARAVELTLQIAGGHAASKLVDIQNKKQKATTITLSSETIKRFLGIDLSKKDVEGILTRLGFLVKGQVSGVQGWHVTVPWFRSNDVTMEQDVVEEIARIYGYHRLPSTLPSGPLTHDDPQDHKEFFWERRVKELLRGAGFTETISYSFTSEHDLRVLGFDPKESFRIANPLVDNEMYLRPRPIASLLHVVSENQNIRDTLRLFELTRVFRHGQSALPEEPLRLAGAVLSPTAFREAKGAALFLLREMGIEDARITTPNYTGHDSWVDAGQSILLLVDGRKIGSVVMLHEKTLRDFGLQRPVALFRVRFQELLSFVSATKRYIPIPKYPPVVRDLAFVLPASVCYADVAAVLQRNPLIHHIELFDVYEGGKLGKGKKNMAFHVLYQIPDRTLTTQEVDRAQADTVKELEKKFEAQFRDF